jgi:predicted Zn-dependent protease
MFICMRTTLNIDDDLMRTVKKYAAETDRTISAIIETALRYLIEQEQRTDQPYRLRWKTVRGGLQAGVDLTDRDALIDHMEKRR